MANEKIELAPKDEQHPIVIPEPEAKEPLKGERSFLSTLDDDLGFLRVVSSVPTESPKNNFTKIKVYISGATKRLYIWDGTNNVWTYVSLTT